MMSVEAKERTEHLLALKVMRLSRPTLDSPLVVTCESRDLPGDLLNESMRADFSLANGIENLALGQLLRLPQSFGTIYLGEMFSSYICVHNDSNETVQEVSVQADLQTTTQRLALNLVSSHATPWAIESLAPQQIVDGIVHHEIKEIGNHILICKVSYKVPSSGEMLVFRKYFKFQVLKPLDVKTKFYNAEDYASDEVYLETQVQNLTVTPIFLEKVVFDPSHLFTVTSLNSLPANKDESDPVGLFGKVNSLAPGASHQFLYCLSPRPDTKKNLPLLRGATIVGKLDIVWRSSLGEHGRLHTSQLQRMAPGYGDIRLTIEDLPNIVDLEKPFDFTCRVTNCCERSMDLVLSLDPPGTPSLLWAGISNQKLPKLQLGTTLDLQLRMVPLSTGLQTISGLRLTDTFLKRVHEYDDLAQVLVVKPQ